MKSWAWLYPRLLAFLRHNAALLTLLGVGIAVPWFIFLEVAEDIWESGGFIGDQPILRYFHQLTTPTLNQVALALTTVGGPWVMSTLGGLIVAVLWWRNRHTDAMFFLASVGGAVVLNVLAKLLFGRPRPALWDSIAPAKFYSFPSGHAMGSAALATALSFLLWQKSWRWLAWIAGFLFALGVGLSRVYLGVHYPSDVLAGWVCSVGWVAGLHLFFSPYFGRLRTWWKTGLGYWNRYVDNSK